MNQSISDPVSDFSMNIWFATSVSISVFGSLMLILTLASSVRNTKLYQGSKVLIVHLLLLQLSMCGIIFPLLHANQFSRFLGTNFTLYCPLFYVMEIGIIHTENWASLLLCVNRYVAIALPHHYEKIIKKRALYAMVIIPWLIGIGNSFPLLFGYALTFIKFPNGSCEIAMKDDIFGAVIWAGIGAYTPLTLIGVIYIVLFVRLAVCRGTVVEKADNKDISGKSDRLKKRRERKLVLAKILMTSYFWHCVCFIPAPVVFTLFPELVAKFAMLPNWLIGTLIPCGYAASPVSAAAGRLENIPFWLLFSRYSWRIQSANAFNIPNNVNTAI